MAEVCGKLIDQTEVKGSQDVMERTGHFWKHILRWFSYKICIAFACVVVKVACLHSLLPPSRLGLVIQNSCPEWGPAFGNQHWQSHWTQSYRYWCCWIWTQPWHGQKQHGAGCFHFSCCFVELIFGEAETRGILGIFFHAWNNTRIILISRQFSV